MIPTTTIDDVTTFSNGDFNLWAPSPGAEDNFEIDQYERLKVAVPPKPSAPSGLRDGGVIAKTFSGLVSGRQYLFTLRIRRSKEELPGCPIQLFVGTQEVLNLGVVEHLDWAPASFLFIATAEAEDITISTAPDVVLNFQVADLRLVDPLVFAEDFSSPQSEYWRIPSEAEGVGIDDAPGLPSLNFSSLDRGGIPFLEIDNGYRHGRYALTAESFSSVIERLHIGRAGAEGQSVELSRTHWQRQILQVPQGDASLLQVLSEGAGGESVAKAVRYLELQELSVQGEMLEHLTPLRPRYADATYFTDHGLNGWNLQGHGIGAARIVSGEEGNFLSFAPFPLGLHKTFTGFIPGKPYRFALDLRIDRGAAPVSVNVMAGDEVVGASIPQSVLQRYVYFGVAQSASISFFIEIESLGDRSTLYVDNIAVRGLEFVSTTNFDADEMQGWTLTQAAQARGAAIRESDGRKVMDFPTNPLGEEEGGNAGLLMSKSLGDAGYNIDIMIRRSSGTDPIPRVSAFDVKGSQAYVWNTDWRVLSGYTKARTTAAVYSVEDSAQGNDFQIAQITVYGPGKIFETGGL